MTIGRTTAGAIKIKTDSPGLRAVNCACCGGGGSCCMYSAQGLYDGVYSVDDLPDSIIVDGVTLQKGVYIYGESALEPEISGAFYGSPNEEFYETTIKLSQGTWYPGQGVSRDSADCLINNDWHDEFANSYTITTKEDGIIVLNRQSICVWKGILGNAPIYLVYNEGNDPSGSGKFEDMYGFAIVGGMLESGDFIQSFKAFNQNLGPSPIGNYSGKHLPHGFDVIVS